MAQIEITENNYNTTCDVYGCSNIAKYIIGKVGEGQAQKTLYCEECLQGIINAVPLDMILNRPELAAVEDEEVGKALEVETAELSLMKFQELKELATKKGLKFEVGMSKLDLINYLTKEV